MQVILSGQAAEEYIAQNGVGHGVTVEPSSATNKQVYAALKNFIVNELGYDAKKIESLFVEQIAAEIRNRDLVAPAVEDALNRMDRNWVAREIRIAVREWLRDSVSIAVSFDKEE